MTTWGEGWRTLQAQDERRNRRMAIIDAVATLALVAVMATVLAGLFAGYGL